MVKKRAKGIILFSLVFSVMAGIAVAKTNEDFCQADYARVLKGEKDFVGAKLEEANFKGMNLSGADFRGADLEKANFENANLTRVNFKNADLEEVNLKGAKITGAIFSGAELEYAKWTDGRTCAEGSLGGCW